MKDEQIKKELQNLENRINRFLSNRILFERKSYEFHIGEKVKGKDKYKDRKGIIIDRGARVYFIDNGYRHIDLFGDLKNQIDSNIEYDYVAPLYKIFRSDGRTFTCLEYELKKCFFI